MGKSVEREKENERERERIQTAQISSGGIKEGIQMDFEFEDSTVYLQFTKNILQRK